MARRIVFVDQNGLLREADKELSVDCLVEVDWKIRIIVDQWEGDVETFPPTYKVRPVTDHPSQFDEYGVISNLDDVQWLSKAMTKAPHDNSFAAIPLVARVNELGIKHTDGRKGFLIEIMTGHDAKVFRNSARPDELVGFVRQKWWWLSFGLLLVWWWFV